ncbi:site-specific integrase [Sediminimonas qiaohouensis]|uniref:site-specific integrase n=1 Tax=Sediminimonas qiaohouensis TaxID=552061 RepID=UPI00047BA5B3|nr:site-specific integrase [Sediminimonas qiaohouensis]
MTRTRDQRAGELPARMPHVPVNVVRRMLDHLSEKEFSQRGMPAALESFYLELDKAGLAPEQVTADVFQAVGTSRSRFRCLVAALRQFAPEVPLSPSLPVRQEWDHWLNVRYNKKEKGEGSTCRVGLAPEDWPEAWGEALPALDRSVRPYGTRLKRLAPNTKGTVVSAVGMLARARTWATSRGVDLPARPSGELFDGFLRYLDEERNVSFGTARDYLESARMFFLRAGLFDEESFEAISDLISALHAEAVATDPGKWARLKEFRAKFTLADVLEKAEAACAEAESLPGNSTAAFKLRQKAMIYAMLVNTGDRQGDLRDYSVGVDLLRGDHGDWGHSIRQNKTGNRKDLDWLWPGTSSLIDRFILADRPDWMLAERLGEIEGMNLLTLSEKVVDKGYINRRLAEDFGIHGHLVRTLIADLFRRTRPDAIWALQKMLGHTNSTTQRVYRSDFDESAAIRNFDALLGALAD